MYVWFKFLFTSPNKVSSYSCPYYTFFKIFVNFFFTFLLLSKRSLFLDHVCIITKSVFFVNLFFIFFYFFSSFFLLSLQPASSMSFFNQLKLPSLKSLHCETHIPQLLRYLNDSLTFLKQQYQRQIAKYSWHKIFARYDLKHHQTPQMRKV